MNGLYTSNNIRFSANVILSDWDHTIAKWTDYPAQKYEPKHFENAVNGLNDCAKAGDYLVLTTGRSPLKVSENAHLLRQVPWHAASGNNGQFYVSNPNFDHFEKNAFNKQYENYMVHRSVMPNASDISDKALWSIGLFHQGVSDVLKQLGYEEKDPTQHFENFNSGKNDRTKLRYFVKNNNWQNSVSVVRDQSTLLVGPFNADGSHGNKTDVHGEIAEEIEPLLTKWLNNKGINIKTSHHKEYKTYYSVHFIPAGADKSAPIPFAIQQAEEKQGEPIKGVISIGDDLNDLAQLAPIGYKALNGQKEIPNYPVVVGNLLSKPLATYTKEEQAQVRKLRANPRTIFLNPEKGKEITMSEALKKQRERIDLKA